MPEPTAEQLDEFARRLHQLHDSAPTVLTYQDVDAIAHAHRDECVRKIASETLDLRDRMAELRYLRGRVDMLEAPATVDQLALFLQLPQVIPGTRDNSKAWAQLVLDWLREASSNV